MLNVECWLGGVHKPFLNHDAKIRQFPDTTKFQRVIRRDFQHAFNRNLLKILTRRFAPRNSYFFRRENIELKRRKHSTLFSIQLFSFFLRGYFLPP